MMALYGAAVAGPCMRPVQFERSAGPSALREYERKSDVEADLRRPCRDPIELDEPSSRIVALRNTDSRRSGRRSRLPFRLRAFRGQRRGDALGPFRPVPDHDFVRSGHGSLTIDELITRSASAALILSGQRMVGRHSQRAGPLFPSMKSDFAAVWAVQASCSPLNREARLFQRMNVSSWSRHSPGRGSSAAEPAPCIPAGMEDRAHVLCHGIRLERSSTDASSHRTVFT